METIVPTPALTQLPFTSACEAWLESRRPYISAKTHHEYKLNIKTLSAFFGELRLQEIDGDLVRAYQRARKLKCGPFAINHECGVLLQIRKRIGIPITDYQPLPLPKEKPGRVLSDEERSRLLRVAKSNPNWEAAYLFAMISVNTGAGPKEVASLRFKDIDLDRETVNVPAHGAKNINRVRAIELNEEAMKGVQIAMDRARRLGSVEPHHFVFPFNARPGHKPDPTRFQTSFKTAWKRLTKAALLGGLQMYDLRRHVATVMMEDPDISDATIEEILGHAPGSHTKKKYSYIRKQARRAALDAIGPKQAIKRRPKSSSAKSPDREELILQIASLFSQLLKSG
jgi:integrase